MSDRFGMKYSSLLLLFISFTIQAESCRSLYEKEAQEIQKQNGFKERVGGGWQVVMGDLRYVPGLEIDANIDNWAEDFLLAVQWGPAKGMFDKSEKERKEWLEAFRKSIKDECQLDKNSYDALNFMLKELMEDGSFCPGNKIIEPGLLGSKSRFKKVLIDAVSSERFPEYCQKNKSIVDDSSRGKKEINVTESEEKKSSSVRKE